MEGKPLSPNHFHLLKKIGELTRSIIEDLCNGRSPTLQIDQFSSYCADASGNCCCSYDLPNGKDILMLRRESQARRLDVLLRVLLIVQQLLQENKHGSKRDIYYMHPSVFKEQSVVDRAINDICILLQCSRHNLNVVSVGNGLVMGWLRFAVAGRKFDCINSPNVAYQIPVNVEDVEDIICVSEYILVVEKESVFQRLGNDKFCGQNRCIVVTGRGYPDIPTRRFLHLLIEKLRLPIYCLVDCDPYGIDILTTYRFGSMVKSVEPILHFLMWFRSHCPDNDSVVIIFSHFFKQMSYDSKSLRLPEMRWLGAFPSDSEKYRLPQQCLLPLTAEDEQKAKGILSRCYMEREVPYWRSELQLMLDRGVKFEIEALSAHSFTFLSDNYLPSKIQGGEYI